MHKEFWRDRDRHNAATDYWRVLCREVLSKKGQLGLWQPWCGIHQNGVSAPLEEGSIYSLQSHAQKKALNIEQYRPKTDDVEISAMVDTFGDGALESPIQYLTICCALSEESAGIARRLIEAWISEEATVQDIQGLIAEVIP